MQLLRRLVRALSEPRAAPTPAHAPAPPAPAVPQVLRAQGKWLNREKKRLSKSKHGSARAQEFEAKFQTLVQRRGRLAGGKGDSLSSAELHQVFAELGISFDEAVFAKVYSLFDADGSGSVDQTEFAVVMAFMCCGSKQGDRADVCYRLFDVDRNGAICKRELNDMVASLMGTTLASVSRIHGGRASLRRFLESEFAGELIRFLEAISWFAPAGERPSHMSADAARELFRTFVEVDAEHQVNVSSGERERLRKAIMENADERGVPMSVLCDAAREVVAMIESGPLLRFKSAVKGHLSYFADPAWTEMGLSEKDGMTPELFRKWTALSPTLFSFFDDLEAAVASGGGAAASDGAAALTAQPVPLGKATTLA